MPARCDVDAQLGLRYGTQSERQRLDLYRPKVRLPGRDPWPVVVWLHAGGWAGGSPASVRRWALAQVCRGYAVVALGYRVSWEAPFPTALVDVKQGIRSIKQHAQDWQLDPTRIALWGASSGAHLASLAALTASFPDHARRDLQGYDASVQAVVHWWGATDFIDYLRPWPKHCPVQRHPERSDSPESKALGCPLRQCLEA
ncbi:MAG: alpha/beta hydrolase fold domain-containing protein, partial [Polyangiales bacterium]